MTGMLSRLAELRANSVEMAIEARGWLNEPSRERNGRASVQLYGELRFLAVASYKLDHDIPAFREGLRECGELFVRLFERFDSGEPIHYVTSMNTYQELFNPLAAGDLDLSLRFARLMGDRDTDEVKNNSGFGLAFGYALKHLVQNEPDLAAPRVAALAQITQKHSKSFAGYATVIQAIIDQSLEAATAGFDEIVSGHPRLTRNGGHFQNTPDEVLCVWGIGMANLARARGLPVRIDNEWIPGDLLI